MSFEMMGFLILATTTEVLKRFETLWKMDSRFLGIFGIEVREKLQSF
jgi:hypothetical protein